MVRREEAREKRVVRKNGGRKQEERERDFSINRARPGWIINLIEISQSKVAEELSEPLKPRRHDSSQEEREKRKRGREKFKISSRVMKERVRELSTFNSQDPLRKESGTPRKMGVSDQRKMT